MGELSDDNRLILLEQAVKDLQTAVLELKTEVNKLRDVASIGRGALWALMKLGALVLIIATVLEALSSFNFFHKSGP